VMHVDGDADQSKGDFDKAVPHHHGSCQGQFLDLPAPGALVPVVAVVSVKPFPTGLAARPSRAVNPGLRPPAA
jgi:hypothetical protein